MKRLIILIFILSPLLFQAQEDIVTNVQKKIDNINKTYIITYDLNKIGDYNYYYIDIKGTDSIKNIPLIIKSISGDFGDTVKTGLNKKIVWEVGKDYKKGTMEPLFEIVAIPNPYGIDPKEKEPVPVDTVKVTKEKSNTLLWIGLGGSVIAGTTLFIVGTNMVSDGNEIYDTYATYTEPNKYPYNDDKTRNDYYDEANSKYKTGQILQITGAAIFAGGSAFFIYKLVQAKKKNGKGSNMGFYVTPIYNYKSAINVTNTMPSGALATFTFKF